ncbi:MAG: hypothetical protein K1X94_11315 [Sandaracinaceae bacterium]|nr:hypothetical protein [Sandaracinaceae bacterium]
MKRHTTWAIALLLLASCERAAPRTQTEATQTEATLLSTETALPASLDAPGRHFGRALSTSRDGAIVVVGAPDDGAAAVQGGAAHVFERTGASLVETAILRTSSPVDLARLGMHVSVSADGTRIAVGAPGAGPLQSGAVLVFAHVGGSWIEEATLVPSEARDSDDVGPVALDGTGTRLLVGAPDASSGACTGCGAAYVFVRSGSSWSEEATLRAPSPAPFEKMGWAVALSDDGTTAFVGIPREDTFATDAGGVLAFTRSGAAWSLETLLSHTDAAPNDFCGLAVATDPSGRRVAIGCPNDDTARGINAGSVRVFVRGAAAWDSGRTLSLASAADDDLLGFSVTVSSDGHRVVAGAPGDEVDGIASAGTVHLFDLVVGDTWAEGGSLRPTVVGRDAFGRSVGLASDGVTVFGGGEIHDTLAGAEAGGAWAFVAMAELGEPCSHASYCASGLCVDGVCCDDACGGGAADDCMACAAPLTGGAAGHCAALAPAVATATTCRGTAGDCDVPEHCVAASTACPADAVRAAGETCRAAAGDCDVAEECDGLVAACPLDAVATSEVVCRPSAGVCDADDHCDGARARCPVDGYAPEGTPCDDADLCNGLERCSLGDCLITERLDCDDHDVCTADACDAIAGCAHEAVGGCCHDASDCLDPDSCTEDTCDPSLHRCMHTPLEGCIPSDAGPPPEPDAGLGPVDAAVGDGGRRDASVDAAAADAATDDAGMGGVAGGCGCRAAGHDLRARGLVVLAILPLLVASRRRRRASSSPPTERAG